MDKDDFHALYERYSRDVHRFAFYLTGQRAQAEDIAETIAVDYEDLEPVVDMLAARQADAPLVHEEWGDNVFIEFFQGADAAGALDRVAQTAAIKVTREIQIGRAHV